MHRIFIVRHGITSWNKEGRWQGHADIELDEEGVEQAQLVAARLSTEPIVGIWSSDLKRAHKTAEVIAGRHRLIVQATSRLRETGLGRWEGLTIPEIKEIGDGDIWERLMAGEPGVRPPGSEPLADVYERIVSVKTEILNAHEGGTFVVVGHGGSIRALICDALEAPVTSMTRFSLLNASVTVIEYSLQRSRVICVNDISHLK